MRPPVFLVGAADAAIEPLLAALAAGSGVWRAAPGWLDAMVAVGGRRRLEAVDAEDLADAREALRAALTDREGRSPRRRRAAVAVAGEAALAGRVPFLAALFPRRASSTSRGSRTARAGPGDRAAARRPRGARAGALVRGRARRAARRPAGGAAAAVRLPGPALRPGAADPRRGGASGPPGPRPGRRGGAGGDAAARRPVPQREHRLGGRAAARARRLAAGHDLPEQRLVVVARATTAASTPTSAPSTSRWAWRSAGGRLALGTRTEVWDCATARRGAEAGAARAARRLLPAARRATSPATSPSTSWPSRAASCGSSAPRSRAS